MIKMNKKNLECPVCKKDVYSGVGHGCKMCGMLIDKDKKFCCKLCMRKFNTINKLKQKKVR